LDPRNTLTNYFKNTPPDCPALYDLPAAPPSPSLKDMVKEVRSKPQSPGVVLPDDHDVEPEIAELERKKIKMERK